MLINHWHLPNRGDSEEQLKAWHAIAKDASWNHFADVKAQFGSASAVGARVVFNIAGNKYRLVTYINYEFHTIYVRFIGTHKEYDEIDVEHV
jgi:mRNA interferase HigB